MDNGELTVIQYFWQKCLTLLCSTIGSRVINVLMKGARKIGNYWRKIDWLWIQFMAKVLNLGVCERYQIKSNQTIFIPILSLSCRQIMTWDNISILYYCVVLVITSVLLSWSFLLKSSKLSCSLLVNGIAESSAHSQHLKQVGLSWTTLEISFFLLTRDFILHIF